jgi:hypothetical protein
MAMGEHLTGALLMGLVLAGCTHAISEAKPVDFSNDTHEYKDSDYPHAYRNWTRHARLVQLDVGTVMEAWATYKSPDFRQAYIAKYAAIYDLPDHDRSTLTKEQLEASRSTFDFHIAAQTTNDRWNDLDRKNSPWRVTLLDETGTELSPTSIRAVKLPELYESQFFPDRTEFTRSYEISFARPTDGQAFASSGRKQLTLRIAGPMGRIDLVWEAKPGS